MNQRIRELALQAGGEFWQRLDDGVVKKDAYITFDPPETLEKFVELIVQECADTAAGERSGWEARKAIEDQFGVKK